MESGRILCSASAEYKRTATITFSAAGYLLNYFHFLDYIINNIMEFHHLGNVVLIRFIGCMRNIFWDGREVESIDRSDSKLATKLRYN